MRELLFVGFSGFLLCLFFTPVCRDFFRHHGLVDHPDDNRKRHLKAVPRMGGVPIALAYGGALLLLFSFNPGGGKIYIQHEVLFHALLPAAALIFATGLIDDLFGLRPWQKLAGQLAAAVLAVSLGVRLETFPTHPSISIVLSVVWLVSCANAVNLIDGMDGLATGVGLLATITTLFVALLSGNYGLALATFPLAGCLLGFLPYNFSPASVFLGDCGSLTIGFVLGCFSLIWSQRSGSLIGMLAPLMVLALPLLDVGLAICRRFLRRAPIFQGDRSHIHHKVLGLGFCTRDAVLILYAVCGIGATFAILETLSNGGLRWAVFIVFCFLTVVGINRLGYVEFSAARRTFSGSFMRRAVQDEIYLHELELALKQAGTIDDCWVIIRSVSTELNFSFARFECKGHSYQEHFIRSTVQPSCHIHLAFGDQGYLSLALPPEAAIPRVMMAALHRVHSSVGERVALLPASSKKTSTTAA